MTTPYQVHLVAAPLETPYLDCLLVDHGLGRHRRPTPDYLEQKGYQQVGKQFPVFLHPRSKEEYALARAKKKSKVKGFTLVYL